MAKHKANEEAQPSQQIGNRGDSKAGQRQGRAGEASGNQATGRYMGQPGKHRK